MQTISHVSLFLKNVIIIKNSYIFWSTVQVLHGNILHQTSLFLILMIFVRKSTDKLKKN